MEGSLPSVFFADNITVSSFNVELYDTTSRPLENTTNFTEALDQFPRYKVAKWLDAYSTYILAAVALLGNSVAMVTVCHMKPVTSTSIYIATLAVVDTLCLLFKILTVALVRIPALPEEISCGLMLCVFFFTQYAASWLIVIISFERFLAVWFPLKVSLVSTKRKAVMCLTLGSLILFALSVWTFWFYFRLEHPRWGIVCVTRRRYDNAMVVLSKLHPIIYILLPFVLILITNILIIVGLVKATRLREGVNANGSRARGRYKETSRLTAMLLTTAIVFLVMELLMVILTLFRHYSKRGTKSFVDDFFFVELAQTLEDTNHAINFFLYFCSGAKFRETFLRLIQLKTCRTPTHPRQLTWSSRMSSYRVTQVRESCSTGETINMVTSPQ